jgi:hypothetical protein
MPDLWFVIRSDPGETGDAGGVLSTPVARDPLTSTVVTRDTLLPLLPCDSLLCMHTVCVRYRMLVLYQ